MAISETARKHHDELFPGHVSTLAVTDPELLEIFDNFAFDEVLRHAVLDTRTRLMVQLAALIGCQSLSEYRVMLGGAGADRRGGAGRGHVRVGGRGRAALAAFLSANCFGDHLTRTGLDLPTREEGQA